MLARRWYKYCWALYIESYNEKTRYYQLGFPNKEVGESFIHSLIEHFAELDEECSAQMRTLLEAHNLTVFFERIQQKFTQLPYQTFGKAQENTYHGLLFSILHSLDLKVSAEVVNNFGRLDLLIAMPTTTYVIELKLDRTPGAGLKQIISKG